MKIPLSNPDITAYEKNLVMEVLNTPNLSLGPKLTEFENDVAKYIGTKYAIAVNSGTSALHLCIKALNINEGDEVITTPFSFVASANCILYERAVPVFVDIDPTTFNIDVSKIEEKITSKTKALLPVHVFGQPCEMDKIKAIAQKYNLAIIEDACEAIGGELLIQNGASQPDYKKVGTLGECGVFAFYPNKQITTGEGGIIVTDNESITKLCRSYRNQGRGENGKWLLHERLGYNYRISDINCALGIAQLHRIDEILKKREEKADWYKNRLEGVEKIKLPIISKDKRRSWFVYVVCLDNTYNDESRNQILSKLLESGIGCNSYFPPIHLQPFYKQLFGYKKGDYPVTEHIADRTIALPFFSNIQEDQVDYICNKFIELLN
jgi:perosamine synthetase